MGKSEEKITVRIDPDIKELIPNYLNNRHKDVQSILAALDKKDFDAIHILGHSMKGSGEGYGFNLITQIGSALEEAGLGKNPGKIKKSIDELSNYLGRVEAVFE